MVRFINENGIKRQATAAEEAAFDAEAEKIKTDKANKKIAEENNNTIRATRKSAYGDIGEQLDEIYKDIDAWKARIKSIKDANPKE